MKDRNEWFEEVERAYSKLKIVAWFLGDKGCEGE